MVHPQFWPESLDYTGKRVVVIGSGATAVSLIPSLTEKASQVTMLQRSPTYLLSSPRITSDRAGDPKTVAVASRLIAVVRWFNVTFIAVRLCVCRGRRRS